MGALTLEDFPGTVSTKIQFSEYIYFSFLGMGDQTVVGQEKCSVGEKIE